MPKIQPTILRVEQEVSSSKVIQLQLASPETSEGPFISFLAASISDLQHLYSVLLEGAVHVHMSRHLNIMMPIRPSPRLIQGMQ